MTELRQRMIEDMRLRGLAEATQRTSPTSLRPPGYERNRTKTGSRSHFITYGSRYLLVLQRHLVNDAAA